MQSTPSVELSVREQTLQVFGRIRQLRRRWPFPVQRVSDGLVEYSVQYRGVADFYNMLRTSLENCLAYV